MWDWTWVLVGRRTIMLKYTLHISPSCVLLQLCVYWCAFPLIDRSVDPRLRPNTDWKMRSREQMWPCPAPHGSFWLTRPPVCLRHLMCRTCTACCLHTISVSVSTCLSTAITSLLSLLMSSCQAPLLCPSIPSLLTVHCKQQWYPPCNQFQSSCC